MSLARVGCLAVLTLIASAECFGGLVGSAVEGSLNFFGSNIDYFVPFPVTVVDPGIEFTYTDTANSITADFTDTQLIVSDQVFTTGVNVPLTLTFTDQSFAGATLSQVSDTFSPGLSFLLQNSQLTIEWAGGPVMAGEISTAVFTFTGNDFNPMPPVPEPSTWTILFMGIVGLALIARRR